MGLSKRFKYNKMQRLHFYRQIYSHRGIDTGIKKYEPIVASGMSR